MTRVRFHKKTPTGKQEVGVTPVLGPMRSVTAGALSTTAIRLSDALPADGLPLRGIRRTCSTNPPQVVEDPVASRQKDFTGLVPDTQYSLTSTPVAENGALGPVTIVTARTAAPIVTTGPLLRRSGRHLIDTGGKVVKIGGFTSYGMPIYQEGSNYNTNYATEVFAVRNTWLANLKAEGYNLHRLSVAGSYWNQLPHLGITQTQYIDRIEAYVNSAIAIGMRTMIGDWSALVGLGGSAWKTRWAELKPFWTALVTRLGKDNPWVIYEPHNEPNTNDGGSMTNAEWLAAMKGTLDHWRTALGYKGILAIDTPSWSWTFPKGEVDALLAYDAALLGAPHACVIANHIYSNGKPAWSQDQGWWEADIYARVLEGYPVLGTEYGIFNGGWHLYNMDYQQQFFAALREKYIPGGMIGFCNFIAGTWGGGNDGNRTHYEHACVNRSPWGDLSKTTAAAAVALSGGTP